MSELRKNDSNEIMEVQGLIAFARSLYDLGHVRAAESIFKQALRLADEVAGTESILVGQVILELYDLYDKQGRGNEAATMWEWLRKILARAEKALNAKDKVPQKWHGSWLN